MKKPEALQRLKDLQEKLRKQINWVDDFRLRLDKNSAESRALNLSRAEDRAKFDELLLEEGKLKKELELLRTAHDELIKEADELFAPYRRQLN